MKGKPVTTWKFYQVEGVTVKRLRRFCPKCGAGVFMAQHKDRYYCGRCGYTETVKPSRSRS